LADSVAILHPKAEKSVLPIAEMAENRALPPRPWTKDEEGILTTTHVKKLDPIGSPVDATRVAAAPRFGTDDASPGNDHAADRGSGLIRPLSWSQRPQLHRRTCARRLGLPPI